MTDVAAGCASAVGDESRVAVRQQLGGAGGDVVGDEVHRTGQVLLGVAGLGQGVDVVIGPLAFAG